MASPGWASPRLGSLRAGPHPGWAFTPSWLAGFTPSWLAGFAPSWLAGFAPSWLAGFAPSWLAGFAPSFGLTPTHHGDPQGGPHPKPGYAEASASARGRRASWRTRSRLGTTLPAGPAAAITVRAATMKNI